MRAAIEPPPEASADIAPEAAGAAVTRATIVIESVQTVKPAGNVNVTGINDLIPDTTAGTVPNVIPVGATALAGATADIVPKPKAATVTSAMRLKVVFVDICFLSISRTKEFP